MGKFGGLLRLSGPTFCIQPLTSMCQKMLSKLLNGKSLVSFWNEKKDKIKRDGLYQDYDQGGIRMTDVVLVLKAMHLAWIPRLLKHANSIWNSVPNFSLRRLGGLNFLLRSNYDIVFLNSKLPSTRT